VQGQLQTRIKRLERRLAEAEEPTKAGLPDWLVEDLQSQGYKFDSDGRPDLSSLPGEPVKE
jgi:hypothetical protein